MRFVTLDDVLWAIAECVEVPEGTALGEQDDPVWLRRSNDYNARYSKAASLLNYHLATTNDASAPRWLDYRDGTGYPLPSDVARREGLEFLVEQAAWYPRWLEFRKRIHIRRMASGPQIPSLNGGLRMINVGGRWTSLPTADDYTKGCPQQPVAIRTVEPWIFP